jgi:hypothetical protein
LDSGVRISISTFWTSSSSTSFFVRRNINGCRIS